MRMCLRLVGCCVALVLAGCGDDGAAKPDAAPAAKGGGSKNDAGSSAEGCAAIEMKAEDHAAVFEIGTKLDPGQEVEVCAVHQVGPKDIWVNSSDLELSAGSHHGLLWLTRYDELPETDTAGNPIELDKLTECESGANGLYDVTRVVAGSQGRFNATSAGVFPKDVALKLPAGAYVVIDLHMLNTHDKPIEACMKVGLNSVPAEQVKHEAGTLFFYDPFIAVPAGGKASARMACPITQDITLKTSVSHMHKRGVGYRATLLDGDPYVASTKPVMTLFETSSWEEPHDTIWSDPLSLAAGQFVDYRCDYDNTGDRDVAQGLDTADEMCMFIGAYWPNKDSLGFCTDEGSGHGVNDDGAAGYQIGSGDLDGDGFLSCFWNADYNGGATQQCGFAECKNPAARYHWQSCFTESCSALGRHTRPFLNCIGAHGDDCTAACQDKAGTCQLDCLTKGCQDLVDAIKSTSCE